MKRFIPITLLAIMLSACRPAPAASPTPAQSATPTPTPFTVLELSSPVPTVEGLDLTPVRGGVRPTLPPPPLPNQPPPTAIPPAKIAVGAPVFRLPDSSPDQIRSITLNPTAPELLISLYDGVNAKTLRVSWGITSQPTIDTLPGEWLQPRYMPDGKRIIANGLKIFDPEDRENKKPKANAPKPDELAFAPNFSPHDGKLVYLKKLDPAQCAGQGSGDDLNFCTGIVVDSEPPQGARPYLSGPAEWSPDGKSLLLTSAGEVGSTLLVYNTTTKQYTQIVPVPLPPPDAPRQPPDAADPNTFVSAIWSGDGQKIYYVSQSYVLFEISVTGGRPTPLGDATQPHLRQGTTFLYFLRPLDGGFFEMWRLNTSSGANERVSDAAFHCAEATWSPDGATLACVDILQNERAVILYAVPK